MSKSNSHIIEKIFRDTLAIQIMAFLTGVIGIIVDGAVTGKFLGADAMAAYGLINPVTTVYLALSGLFSNGISTLTGRYLGKGDTKETNNVFSSCVISGVVTGGVIMLITIAAAGSITALLGAEDEIQTMAVDYLRGFGISAPASVLMVMMLPIMQLDGDRSRVFKAVVCMTTVNIVLDFANVFLFHLGLLGMALATTISYYAAIAVLLLHFRKKKSMFNLSFKNFRWLHVKGMLSYGFPYSYQQICRTFLVMVVNWILLRFWGAGAVAAYAIVISAGYLCLSIGSGIGTSVSMLTGVLSGEEDEKSLRTLLVTALKYAVVSGVIIIIAVFIIAKPLIALFINMGTDPQVFDMAVKGIKLFALSTVIYSVNLIFRSYFQGMHLFKMSYFFCLMDNFVGTVIAAYVLGMLMGLDGVWLAYVVGETFALAVLWAVACIKNRHIGIDLKYMMFLPNDFGCRQDMQMECSMHTMEQVAETSVAVEKFCKDRGGTDRKASILALVVEEMAGNIIEHGFTDGKKHSIDFRIMCEEDCWIIRLRDDCRAFNPKDYMEQHMSDDPEANPGMRLVKNIIEDVKYMNTLKLNNIILRIEK